MDAKDLLNQARLAGEHAAAECRPTPMIIEGYPPIEDGVCGFAWINFKCNNSPTRKFINQLKKAGIASSDINAHSAEIRPGVYGGFSWWCPLMTQSMEIKAAYMKAAATLLQAKGINCYSASRMD